LPAAIRRAHQPPNASLETRTSPRCTRPMRRSHSRRGGSQSRAGWIGGPGCRARRSGTGCPAGLIGVDRVAGRRRWSPGAAEGWLRWWRLLLRSADPSLCVVRALSWRPEKNFSPTSCRTAPPSRKPRSRGAFLFMRRRGLEPPRAIRSQGPQHRQGVIRPPADRPLGPLEPWRTTHGTRRILSCPRG
jgi:hypothetical protein